MLGKFYSFNAFKVSNFFWININNPIILNISKSLDVRNNFKLIKAYYYYHFIPIIT